MGKINNHPSMTPMTEDDIEAYTEWEDRRLKTISN
jgi:hypothetical protein